jgi:hypothetical protein
MNVTAMIDCMVNYFGDGDERDAPTRYFCYHVVAGPGPTAQAGVAVITALAASHAGEQCLTCGGVHFVQAGGPAAAVAKALRHLDAHHEGDGLRKAGTPFRRPSQIPGGTGADRPDVGRAGQEELTSFWAV